MSQKEEQDIQKQVNSEEPIAKYAGIFSGLSVDTPIADADLVKLGTIWDELEQFIVTEIKDGFQLRDIYSLITAVMNSLELFFPGVSGVQLKKYGIYIVNRLLKELEDRNVIPSGVGVMLNMIPVGLIFDLLSNLGKKSMLVNKVSNSNRQFLIQSDWVRRNWMCRQLQADEI